MNKSELINVMAEEAGLTKVQAKIALEALVGATEKALKKGERLASGVGCHFLLQGIFPTQGLNPGSHIVGRRFTN